MKPPRPRITVRRLMVAVAAVGVVFGIVIQLFQRSLRFRRIADHHWAAFVGRDVSAEANRSHYFRGSMTMGAMWHGQMALKYDYAARYPWLPVAPDSPNPE